MVVERGLWRKGSGQCKRKKFRQRTTKRHCNNSPILAGRPGLKESEKGRGLLCWGVKSTS